MRGQGDGFLRDLGFIAAAVLPLTVFVSLVVAGSRVALTNDRVWLAATLVWLLLTLGFAVRFTLRERRLLTTLLDGLREGDYGVRLRNRRSTSGDLVRAFNALAEQLGGEVRHGVETDVLLSQLLAGLDVAVLIVDDRDRLVDVNPAGEALLGKAAAELIGDDARRLGLAEWLTRDTAFIDRHAAAAGKGPWEVRRVGFRRRGRSHRLLVVTDVSRALREEERRAWRDLIRVLGHEINNSLGSIQSTAGLLQERAVEKDAAFGAGLELIERRSRSLGAFIRRYAELASLPPPHPKSTELSAVIRHVAMLERGVPVAVESDGPLSAYVDRAQIEQALINLVRNAVEAARETGGGVRVRGRTEGNSILIEIEDDGPGIAPTDNLFVPFFTTKPGGSGVGLVLARQIIEAHGGSLQLANRAHRDGAVATIRLAKFRDG